MHYTVAFHYGTKVALTNTMYFSLPMSSTLMLIMLVIKTFLYMFESLYYYGFVLGVHLLEESILKMCLYLVLRLLILHSVIASVMLKLR